MKMTSRKLKLNSCSEDEDNTILKPCLQIGPDVQLRDVPTTGEEYLLKVMKERRNYAAITTCDKDLSAFSKNQSCFVEEIPRASVSERLKPTIEWQNIQVADFSEVRMKISRLRNKKSECPNKIIRLQDKPETFTEWKEFFDNSEPTLSCVLGLKNASVDSALENMIETLNEIKPGNTIDYKTGKWIYALLACVIQPLLSETTCILRDLARKCAEIRSHINPESDEASELVAPMNIFICLVGRYFRQYDLAD